MNNNYETEWIPSLLDQLSSVPGLSEELLSDIMLAQACLQGKNSLKPKKKIKKKKKKKKLKMILEGPPYTVNVEIRGTLPRNLTNRAFLAAVRPMFEDIQDCNLVFVSCNRMNNGTYCYNFTGKCPIHRRIHQGGAKIWQLKQHPRSDWCGFKCWRGDCYQKLYANPILCDI